MKLSFESENSFNIYYPTYSSDEEIKVDNTQVKYGTPIKDSEEDYKRLEQMFIGSSDSEEVIQEVDVK